MSIKNFIPTIWSDMLVNRYEEMAVFAPLMNRSYEADVVNYGDTIKVNTLGDFDDYAYTGTVTYTDMDDSSQFIKIDQKRVISKQIDDVDAAQIKPKLVSEYGMHFAQGFLRTQEAYLGGLYTSAGITSGSTSSPTSITSANVISKIGDIAAEMDENDVPDDGRVAVVAPWLAQKMVLAGVIRDTDNSDILSAGYIGNFQGFQVYKSNRISKSGTTWYANMFFRRNDTIALVDQIKDMEALRLESPYADGLRSMMVYGAKVLRPESLAVGYFAEGSETAI